MAVAPDSLWRLARLRRPLPIELRRLDVCESSRVTYEQTTVTSRSTLGLTADELSAELSDVAGVGPGRAEGRAGPDGSATWLGRRRAPRGRGARARAAGGPPDATRQTARKRRPTGKGNRTSHGPGINGKRTVLCRALAVICFYTTVDTLRPRLTRGSRRWTRASIRRRGP